MSPVSQKKALAVFAGTENAYKLAKQYKIKTAFGADILFDAQAASRQSAYLAMLARWYTSAETLKMATADNAALMALSGPVNPYPGELGVIEKGALADLLLVDGDPISNIRLIEEPKKNFVVIMKDGVIYKNTLRSEHGPNRKIVEAWSPHIGLESSATRSNRKVRCRDAYEEGWRSGACAIGRSNGRAWRFHWSGVGDFGRPFPHYRWRTAVIQEDCTPELPKPIGLRLRPFTAVPMAAIRCTIPVPSPCKRCGNICFVVLQEDE